MQYSCPKCGSSVQEGINFCGVCGQQFNWPASNDNIPNKTEPISQQNIAQTQPINSQPTTNIYKQVAETASQRVAESFSANKATASNKKPKGCLLVFCAFAFIILVSVISAIINPSTDSADNNGNNVSKNNQDGAYLSCLRENSNSPYGLEFNSSIDTFITQYNRSRESIKLSPEMWILDKSKAITISSDIDGHKVTVYSFSFYGYPTETNSMFDPNGFVNIQEVGAIRLVVNEASNKIIEADYYISTKYIESITDKNTYDFYTSDTIDIIYSAIGVDSPWNNYFSTASNKASYKSGLVFYLSQTSISGEPCMQTIMIAANEDAYNKVAQ